MAVFHDTYVGFATEGVYGTFMAPDIFPEFLSEGIAGKYERIDSEGIRAGKQVARTDRFAINPKGAEGAVKFELMDQGFEVLLRHALGSLSAAVPSGGFVVNTVKLGSLDGLSLSAKVGRVDTTGTINPFDYSGGKVKSWEIANSVDGIASLNLDLDFAKEATGGSAATPSYPAGAQLFTFVGGAFTIAGTEYAVADVSVKGENSLNVERYALRQGGASTTKREPKIEGLRSLSFEVKGEFESMTHYNRFKSTTAAGALASLAFTWDTPQGGQLSIALPNSRFDAAGIAVDGPKILEQTLSGIAMSDGTAEPITITYKAKS